MKKLLTISVISILAIAPLGGCGNYFKKRIVFKKPVNEYLKGHRRPCANPVAGQQQLTPEQIKARCGRN